MSRVTPQLIHVIIFLAPVRFSLLNRGLTRGLSRVSTHHPTLYDQPIGLGLILGHRESHCPTEQRERGCVGFHESLKYHRALDLLHLSDIETSARLGALLERARETVLPRVRVVGAKHNKRSDRDMPLIYATLVFGVSLVGRNASR